MLNKKETSTISLVILKEDLEYITKLISEFNEKNKANFTRSDFIRSAIQHELRDWEK